MLDWTWMSRLEMRGSPEVGLVDERHDVAPLYRIGDTLFLGMGPELLLAYVRAED